MRTFKAVTFKCRESNDTMSVEQAEDYPGGLYVAIYTGGSFSGSVVLNDLQVQELSRRIEAMDADEGNLWTEGA